MRKHSGGVQAVTVIGWQLCGVLAVALMITAVPVAAQSGGQGRGTLKAVGIEAVPPGTPIEVIADEFTDVNTRLREVIEQAMAERGYQIVDSAAMKLSFDTEIDDDTQVLQPGMNESAYQLGAADAGVDAGNPCIGSECTDLGREMPDLAAPDEVSIPLGDGPPAGTGSNYGLNFVLGQDGYPPIWQGSVTAVLPRQDPFDIAKAMVPPLVAAIGTNADNTTVSIGR